MGCDGIFLGNKSTFVNFGAKKDGLDVYYHRNYNKIFFQSEGFICPLCKNEFSESETQKIKSLYKNSTTVISSASNILYPFTGYESISDCQKKLDDYNKFIEKEENFLKQLYYKHKCIKKNQEIYLYLYYTQDGISIRDYIIREGGFTTFFYELSLKMSKDEKKKVNYDDSKIISDGYFRGKKLCGKVEIVNMLPDFKVQVVDSSADLRVKKVESFPAVIGEWQFVNHLPDFKIQFVDSFDSPDFKIQFVDSYPGVP